MRRVDVDGFPVGHPDDIIGSKPKTASPCLDSKPSMTIGSAAGDLGGEGHSLLEADACDGVS